MRNILIALALVVIALIAWPTHNAVSEEIREVRIENFPASQRIHGRVEIQAPIRSGAPFLKEGVMVPPARRDETTAMVSGGVIETDGFKTVELSLQGEEQGANFRGGAVGAVLIPDQKTVMRAFREAGQLQFPLEVSAEIAAGGSSFFSSEQTRRHIGFPRYRIFFYNSSNRPAEVNLFAYLVN